MKYKNESSFWNKEQNIKWFADYPPSDYWVRFLKKIKNRPDKRALDLGCGAGRHTKVLEDLGFDTYACDCHIGMVHKTQDIMRCAGWSEVKSNKQITKQSLEKLSYDSDLFDLIICHGVYHNAFNLEMLKKFISETSRILKKGGKILFNVFTNESLADDLRLVDEKNSLYLTKENMRMLLVSPELYLELFASNNLFPQNPKNLVRYSSQVSTGTRTVFRGMLVKK